MRLLFFFFFFTATALQANTSREASSRLIYDGEPSTMVHGLVDAHSGHLYLSEEEIPMEGVDALSLTRFYQSIPYHNSGEMGYGTDISYPSFIHPNMGAKGISQFPVESMGGCVIHFTGPPIKDGKVVVGLPADMLARGLTNTGSGVISGRTNLKNKRLTFYPKDLNVRPLGSKGIIEARTGAGDYQRYESVQNVNNPKYTFGYRLLEWRKPSGNWIEFSYNGKHCTWHTATLRNALGEPIRTLKRDPSRSDQNKTTYVASNGKWVTYHDCEKFKRYSLFGFIDRIESSDFPEKNYGLVEVAPRARLFQVNTFMTTGAHGYNVVYDKQRRVKKLQTLNNPGNSWIDLYTFKYHKRDRNQKVIDVRGLTKRYLFDDKSRLEAIAEMKEGSRGDPYRRELLRWGHLSSPDVCNLITRAYEDDQGVIPVCMTMTYDKSGNPIKRELFGNLTGETPCSLKLDKDHRPINEDCEVWAKESTYSDDGMNLKLSEWDEEGLEHLYQYKKGTDLLTAKLTKAGGEIVEREFRAYDKNAVQILQIVDDGSGANQEDLTDVKVRLVTRISPVMDPQAPGFSLPQEIRQSYYDHKTGEEKLLNRETREYCQGDYVTERAIYDANDELQYTLSTTYDERGRVTSERDADGILTHYQYDVSNNRTYAKREQSGFATHYAYDRAHRLIRTEEVHDDGTRLAKKQRYDALGAKTRDIDEQGNITKYRLDHLGRPIEVMHPEIQMKNGDVFQPTTVQVYDTFDQVISKTDANGYTTLMEYNIRGKKTRVNYPDSTEERWIYRKNGKLDRHIFKDKGWVQYFYDGQQRLVGEERRGPNGELIAETKKEYDRGLLVREIDALGSVIEYFYDGSGRRIEERKSSGGRAIFEYDAMGRQVVKKSWFGGGDGDFIAEIKVFDEMNRVVESRKEDAEGNWGFRELTTYDTNGNEVRKEVFSEEQRSSVTYREYNSRKQVIREVDAMGNETHIIYDPFHKNAIGQSVVQKRVTDPMGNQVITTHNVKGEVVSVVCKNSMGEVRAKSEDFYDGCGNKVLSIYSVLEEGKETRVVRNKWEYGPENRLVIQQEAAGTPEEKETVYGYNAAGQKWLVGKPDGTRLYHYYNEAGLLSRLYATDHTVDYTYSYDANGGLLQVKDDAFGQDTVRRLNEDGQVIFEQQGNGVKMAYTYDRMGRPTEIELPDGTGINYRFKSLFLNQVVRVDKGGNELYKHEYSYDRKGQVIGAVFVDGQEAKMERDANDRLVSMDSGCFLEKMTRYDALNNLHATEQKDPTGQHSSEFDYDDLYQLKRETGPIGESQYRHDSLFNRTEKNGKTYVLNHLNQVLHDGQDNFSYDMNGNLLEREKTQYRYDALDRLIQVVIPGKVKLMFTYDSSNRRLEKRVLEWKNQSWVYTKFKRFIYDGEKEIGAIDNSGKIVELRVLGVGRGAEIGAAVAIELQDKVYVPHHNHRGDVVVLADGTTGEVVESYHYTAFGEDHVYDGDQQMVSESVVGNPWRFSSKRLDDEMGLLFYGRRYYDPGLGRWVTPDPKGFADGPNLYAFVKNNPLTLFDLYGLSTERDSSSIFNRTANRVRKWYRGPRKAEKRSQSPERDHEDWSPSKGAITRPENGVVGRGEVSDKQRVTFVNGIMNDRDEYIKHAERISGYHGNVNVHYTGDPSKGLFKDLVASMGLDSGRVTDGVRALTANWRARIGEMGGVDGGGNILHYAHSKGCLTTRLAAKQLSSKEQGMIDVIAFGPPIPIERGVFSSAQNYVLPMDPVTIPGRFYSHGTQGRYDLNILDTSFSGFVGHSIENTDYNKTLVRRGGIFVGKYGEML